LRSLVRLTPSEIKRRQLEEQAYLRQMREDVGRPKVSCELHDWRPEARGPQPLQPESHCPACQAEWAEKHDTQRTRVEVLDPQLARSTPVLDAAWDAHVRKTNLIESRSVEETALLERMDDAREDAIRVDHHVRRPGVPVMERIEGGQIVTYYSPYRHGRSGPLGLIRVAG
jgi:hypothetical protein